MDVYIGRRLPRMLRQAGLTDVGVHASLRVFGHRDLHQTLMVYRAEQCRDDLLVRGLITEPDLDECIGALRAHLAEPDIIVLHATLFQAWGTVPQDGPVRMGA